MKFYSCQFRITIFKKDWFYIDSSNGFLYTKSSLDRELVETVNLVIGVEDLNSTLETRPQIATSSFY